MIRNKKHLGILSLFAGLCALALVLAGCGGSAGTEAENNANAASTEAAATDSYTLVADGTLTCASDLECPPFSSYKAGTSEPEGFEVDLMAAVAEKMGLESAWVPKMDFDVLLNQVAEGTKFDVGVANITINDERKEIFDFTDPYYVANIAFVTNKSNAATSAEDFNQEGMRIGVQAGTTGEAWVKENLTNLSDNDIVRMIPSSAMLSVQTGSESEDALDAMVCDLPVANSLIAESYGDLQVLEEIPTGDAFGIAVSKKNPQLTEAINKALGELEADGTIDELVQKWLA